MPRAVQTAQVVRRSLPAAIPIHVNPDLSEGAPLVPWPLSPKDEGRWARRFENITLSDGSPLFASFWACSLTLLQWKYKQTTNAGPRIERAFRSLFYRSEADQQGDSHTLVVCHANVIRYFVCRALQLPPEAWLRLSLPHCSISHVKIHPDGRVSLSAFGDIAHLGAHWPHAISTH